VGAVESHVESHVNISVSRLTPFFIRLLVWSACVCACVCVSEFSFNVRVKTFQLTCSSTSLRPRHTHQRSVGQPPEAVVDNRPSKSLSCTREKTRAGPLNYVLPNGGRPRTHMESVCLLLIVGIDTENCSRICFVSLRPET